MLLMIFSGMMAMAQQSPAENTAVSPLDTASVIADHHLRVGDSLTVPRRVKAHPVKAFFENGDSVEQMIVGGDTVQVILQKYDFGRYNRGLFNYLFIPRKQWSFGITASYGSFDAEDVQMLSMLKDFDFQGKVYSISPSVSYFIKNNQSLGLRFSYNRSEADLGGLTVDIDEDMNFSLKDVAYYSQSYDLSVFYRNYIGLSAEKRFGIFNEVELSFKNGSSRFTRLYNGEPRETHSITTGAGLNFSPGLTMYIMDYVSFNVSFGVFGLNLVKEKQTTNGVEEGDRFTSGANFRFNLFNIKFGVSVTI